MTQFLSSGSGLFCECKCQIYDPAWTLVPPEVFALSRRYSKCRSLRRFSSPFDIKLAKFEQSVLLFTSEAYYLHLLHKRVMSGSSSSLPFSAFVCVYDPKLGFPWNLFMFQNINFTHSLLSSLTMRKLCNEGIIKLGAVWKCQTSERKREQSRRRHLSFNRVCALHGPEAHVHVLNVSFMMSGFESVMLQMSSEKKCDGTVSTIAHHLAGATLVPPDPRCYQVMFYVFLRQALEGQTICLGSWRWNCAWWRIMRSQRDLWLDLPRAPA